MSRSEQDREAVIVALTSQASFGRAAVAALQGPLPASPVGNTLLEARGMLMEAEGGWLRR